jgi:pimeloyl-ACP methyl ester carboxylesterase
MMRRWRRGTTLTSMANLPYPVIVVPGITATYLRDDYSLPPDFPWTVMTKDFARAQLHPDDPRYEARQPARLRPDQLYEIAYGPLIEALRYELTSRPEAPVPVYPFGYDWRQPIEASERALGDFVQEVISRTKLLRHYDRDGYGDNPRVNLLGHSMGGLVIAGYIEANPQNHSVGKIATLAAPFRGSYEPVLKITTGTADLGVAAPSSAEREAARLTPSLYQLMPSFPGAIPGRSTSGIPDDFFDPAVWQASILQSLGDYVKNYGLQRTDTKGQARVLLDTLLTGGRRHRARLERLRLDHAGLVAADWLCVAGVDSTTRYTIEIEPGRGGPQLKLSSVHRRNDWADTDVARRMFTGDGTVPLEGAIPAFLPREAIVCVRPGDYGYWEVGDKIKSDYGGFHGIMPNMNMIQRLLVRHFKGSDDRYGNTWGRGLPGIAQAAWRPAVFPLRWDDGS